MRNRTLFGSLMLIGVMVAALAGGSYAVFTDTEAVHVKFEAGTIDIKLNGQEGFQTVHVNPDGYNDWKPGDSTDWPLRIRNTGENTAWIQIYVYPTGAWDQGAPEFWDVASQHIGPDGPWFVDPGQLLELSLHVEFPQSIGNDYQGAQGDLLILVVAKQYRNKFEEGYDCVALENKDESFLPILDDDIEGVVCYKVEDGKLLVDVNGYGLQADEYFQLALNGPGGCANFPDVSFAGMGATLYHSGWYQHNPGQLSPTCDAEWNEGVWNFVGTDGEVKSSGVGSISWGGELAGLPSGHYENVKFVVKLISGYAGAAPSAGDYGTSWTPMLVEMNYLDFTIP